MNTMGDTPPTIRQARAGDVEAIDRLIAGDSEHLLPRTREEIAQLISTAWVAEREGEIVGCVTLEIYSSKIAEVRSLIVKEGARGQGAGRALVHAAVSEALNRGVHEVLVVTSIPEFFQELGFGPCLNEKYALFWTSGKPEPVS